jgi:hypothetical protein
MSVTDTGGEPAVNTDLDLTLERMIGMAHSDLQPEPASAAP